MGVKKSTTTLKSSLAISYKVKLTLNLRPSNSTPRHLHERNKNIGRLVHKCLKTVRNSSTLKTVQSLKSINGKWTHKPQRVLTTGHGSVIKAGISDLFNNLDGSQIHDAEWKKPDMREDIWHDFLHTKLGKRSLMDSNRKQTRGSPGVRTGYAG